MGHKLTTYVTEDTVLCNAGSLKQIPQLMLKADESDTMRTVRLGMAGQEFIRCLQHEAQFKRPPRAVLSTN